MENVLLWNAFKERLLGVLPERHHCAHYEGALVHSAEAVHLLAREHQRLPVLLVSRLQCDRLMFVLKVTHADVRRKSAILILWVDALGVYPSSNLVDVL